MRPIPNIRHVRQAYPTSCGAASFAAIANVSEHEAIKLCLTKPSGTSTANVCKALRSKGIGFKLITINNDWPCVLGHLRLLSFEYPIYVSGEFVSNSGRGRNSHRHHAITLWRGDVYDSGEDTVFPMDAYSHVWNRKLVVKEAILAYFDSPGI